MEPIKVKLYELWSEAVGLGLGGDQSASEGRVGSESTAKHGHERLQRSGGVAGKLVAPEQERDALLRDGPAASRKEDLEDVLWASAAQVARTTDADAILDRQRPERPDNRVVRMTVRQLPPVWVDGACMANGQPNRPDVTPLVRLAASLQ